MNMVLRNIWTYQREDVNRRLQKKYNNEEFHDLCPSPSVVIMMGYKYSQENSQY
jgi:hypothetical protein